MAAAGPPGTGFTPQFHWAKGTSNLETSDTACESLGLGLSYAPKIIAKLVLVAELLTVECMEILDRVPKFWTF